MFKKILRVKKMTVILLLITFSFVVPVHADTYLDLEAVSAILIDEISGKVMYAKEGHKQMYPASMTKILTAILALDYLAPDELVKVGSEINLVPAGSSMAQFVNGEYITVINLLRGLLIKSGNETANVVAINVARRVTGREEISYQEAETIFCGLMNEKAKSYGAYNSNFKNPHGYHDSEHYTTAYDMAIISREALKYDIIRQISAEVSFLGGGAGDNDVPLSINHDWVTHNNLLIKSDNYYYPYATGIKTGFMNEAGYCISASAEKEDKRLVAVIMFATENGRLADSIKLFNYGFDYYRYEQLHTEGVVVGAAALSNGKKSEGAELDLLALGDFTCLLNKDEMEKLKREFVFEDKYLASKTASDGTVMLKAPIAKDTVVGTVSYVLNGEVLYTGEITAGRDVSKRGIISNIQYFFSGVFEEAFSVSSIPYWLGGAAALVFLAILLFTIRRRKSSRKSIYSYNKRRRY